MMLNAIFKVVGYGEPRVSGLVLLQLVDPDPEEMENVKRFVCEYRDKPVMLLACDYKKEDSLVSKFLEECCEECPCEEHDRWDDIHRAFVGWCVEKFGLSEKKVFTLRSLKLQVADKKFGCVRLRAEWQPGGAS